MDDQEDMPVLGSLAECPSNKRWMLPDAVNRDQLPNKDHSQPRSSIWVSSLSLAERLAHHTATRIPNTIRLTKQDALDPVKAFLIIFVFRAGSFINLQPTRIAVCYI
jgi:hypothetical protein